MGVHHVHGCLHGGRTLLGYIIAVMPLHFLHIHHGDPGPTYRDLMATLAKDPRVLLYGQEDLARFLEQKPEDSIASVHLEQSDIPANGTLLAQLHRCRQVIVHSRDYAKAIEELISDHDLHNFEWHTPNAPPLSHARHTINHEYLLHMINPYFNEPAFLAHGWQERLRLDQERDHTFEVMLGFRKPHRDFCQQWVTEHVPGEHYLMSEPWTPGVDYRVDQFPADSVFREPEMQSDPAYYTVKYLGKSIWQSMVLPIRLYEKTQHSVVCETWSDVCFPTEKTVKPIMGQRLFVVLSCQGFMAHLRRLGFQTFGDIIDESYDSEPDDTRRWTMALEQMRSLIGRPWPELRTKLQPVVAHNLQHLHTLPKEMLVTRIRDTLAGL